MKTAQTLFAIATLGFAGLAANAADAGDLEVKTVVQKEAEVVAADGSKSVELVAADAVVPGEEVIYTVTFTNVSDKATDNIVISNPIPSQLTYVYGSAFGPGTTITFSVDGGQTFGSPETLVVVDGDVERAATTEDFTNIRWEVQNPLNVGQRGFARFRARLN
ncbi:MAG: hypothetical protein AAGC71_17355 [Pseudomonadota bacterium]